MSQLDEEKLRRGFNRLAPIYDLLVHLLFGRRLARSRTALLEKIPECQRALVIGDGSGEFLLKLLQSGGVERVVSVDISEEMLNKQRQRLHKSGFSDARVEFLNLSVHELTGSGEYDLIVTNYFLDIFGPEELIAVMDRLNKLLKVGGYWSFADFIGGPPLFFRVLYAFFDLLCGIKNRHLPDYNSYFQRLGLKRLFAWQSPTGWSGNWLFQRVQ